MNLLLKGASFSLIIFLTIACKIRTSIEAVKKPNVIFVFADQWRAQDVGYEGNTIVQTPAIDKFATESVVFTNAVSGCPVCSPYRASLLTGQYPLTHGIFYNDKPLNPEATTIAKVFKHAGYETGYIGKWHLNGHKPGEDKFKSRMEYIPKERRQGFDFWQVLECTHNYNNSFYYEDTPERLTWPGYDAIEQTKSAIKYISEKSAGNKPFLLFLSWGSPHEPYHTAPEQYKKMYSPEQIEVRPNVPDELKAKAQKDIAGYYAHITALDDCMNELLAAIDEQGIAENTVVVFTSDHGDMLYSHGMEKKQKPWDESLRIPFLLRYPDKLGKSKKIIDMPINTPDIMPTLLGLSGLRIPETVEGTDYSKVIAGEEKADNDAVLIQCPVPFHQWSYQKGGREYRGVRTRQFTYVCDLKGPWLLYDNKKDPYQLNNLCNIPEYENIQADLENKLQKILSQRKDEFLEGSKYMKLWNHEWDNNDSIKKN